MKKKIIIIIGLILIGGISAFLAHNMTQKAAESEIELNFNDFIQEDGSFRFHDSAYGMTLQEVEKTENIQFPDIPYECEEWASGVLPNHPEEVYDYKTEPYQGSVQYTAYVNDKPLRVTYGNYVGYMLYQFKGNELSWVMVIFRNQPSIRDSKMDYSAGENNVEEIYDQISEDLTELLGPCEHPDEKRLSKSWHSETEDANGYRSSIGVLRQYNDMNPEQSTIIFAVYRNKLENGTWTD